MKAHFRRINKKIKTLQDVITQLQERNLINANAII